MPAEAEDNGGVARLAGLLRAAGRILAFTGAGISTESGIPDFRSPGGIWSRMRPITYQEFRDSEAARLEDWRRRFAMNEEFARAEPNAGHRALARLVAEGRDLSVVTQNIDGLHQRTGLPPERLLELHGNATFGRCLDCARRIELDEVRAAIAATGAAPRCPACDGPVKAAIVSFGEPVPEAVLHRALQLARSADLCLVVGSSLVVHPAAAVPQIARESGAELVILNRDPTPLDAIADLVLRLPIGAVFRRIFPQLCD